MIAVSHENVVELLVAEIGRMAAVCREIDPGARVPSCPDWDLADLMGHIGTVHRWAGTMVERHSQARLGRDDLELGRPEDPTALPDWVAAGADFLAERFSGIDTEAEMWAWGWPKNAGFWPRRMLHETGIHRADADLTAATVPRYDADIAADGVDELLDNLSHARYFAPAVAELKGDGERLAFVAPDLDEGWVISLEPDGFTWTHARVGDDVNATLTATASDLLLVLYGRRPIGPGEISGDGELIDRWIANSAL